jgi:hypothetical protein
MNDILFLILLALPIVVAVIALIQRFVKRRSDDTAGYVYNGRRWVAWVFVAIVASWVILYVGNKVGGSGGSQLIPSFKKDNIALLILFFGLPVLYMISYVLVAFRPATAEQVAEAKGKKSLVVDMTGKAAAGLWGGFVAMLAALGAGLMMVLNPIHIISQVGNTITYVKGGMGASLMNLVAMGFLVVIVILIVLFVSWFAAYTGSIVLGLSVIVRYLLNLIIFRNGPRPGSGVKLIDALKS